MEVANFSQIAVNSDSSENDDYEELGLQKTPFKSGFISIIGNANVGKSTLMNGNFLVFLPLFLL